MEYDIYDNYQHIKGQDVYEYRRIPLNKKCKKLFRQADFYANPITLRYKGEKKFYTNFGALTSSLIIAGMLALTIYQVTLMLSQSQITFQESSSLALPAAFELGVDNGFTFAFRLYNKDTKKTFDYNQYFNVSIIQINKTWYNFIFNHNAFEQGVSLRQNSKRALLTKSNSDADMFSRIVQESQRHRWRFHRQTKDQLEVQFMFLNANFDQQDLDDPIKNYMDTRLFEDLLPNNNLKRINIYVKNSSANLLNDYLRIDAPVDLQFYQVSQIEKYINTYNDEDGELVKIVIQASSYKAVYERRVYSLFDVFAALGGIYNSLFTIGFLFCAAFSYNLYLSSLIRKLYHFKARFERKDENQKDNRERSNTTEYESQAGYIDTNNSINNQQDWREQLQREQNLGVKEIKEEVKQVIGKDNKANFNHKTVSILKSLICCLILRNRTKLRNDPSRRNVLYFLKGRQMLNKEMDIAWIVHQIRKVKYLMKILLDKDQRRLFQLKRTQQISSDEGYDEDDYKKKLRKDKLIDLYVDVLRTKKLKRSDNKLLEITGFKNVLSILNSQKAYEKVAAEWQANELYQNEQPPPTPQLNQQNSTQSVIPAPKYFDTISSASNFYGMTSFNKGVFTKSTIMRTQNMNDKRGLHSHQASRDMIKTQSSEIYDQSLDLKERKHSPISLERQNKKNKLPSQSYNRNFNINENNADYFYESPDMGNSIEDYSGLDTMDDKKDRDTSNDNKLNTSNIFFSKQNLSSIQKNGSKMKEYQQLHEQLLQHPDKEFFTGTSFRRNFPERMKIESIKLQLRKESQGQFLTDNLAAGGVLNQNENRGHIKNIMSRNELNFQTLLGTTDDFNTQNTLEELIGEVQDSPNPHLPRKTKTRIKWNQR
ncbi:UNKNOWN [Stylonychia lemnae]|uniref:Transmembrane protein n=1 Tax=Stylonychia lemnae TaxID=5949 RepID=A0A078A6P2_STYLE|nr:UNKNOWN [Stylonychia lemnae]|eukprot:CDW77920.1 UNKNOWN [Stylonychia lemnae]